MMARCQLMPLSKIWGGRGFPRKQKRSLSALRIKVWSRRTLRIARKHKLILMNRGDLGLLKPKF